MQGRAQRRRAPVRRRPNSCQLPAFHNAVLTTPAPNQMSNARRYLLPTYEKTGFSRTVNQRTLAAAKSGAIPIEELTQRKCNIPRFEEQREARSDHILGAYQRQELQQEKTSAILISNHSTPHTAAVASSSPVTCISPLAHVLLRRSLES